ncbi:MAG: hypothetical protein FWG50_07150 [Kiritimatiellaeota bacterium]|nr:hypothetical protein [Kiritimatiellota bacterium]
MRDVRGAVYSITQDPFSDEWEVSVRVDRSAWDKVPGSFKTYDDAESAALEELRVRRSNVGG